MVSFRLLFWRPFSVRTAKRYVYGNVLYANGNFAGRRYRNLYRIYVLLSKLVLAMIGLWTAVAYWNHWFDPMLYIASDENQVLQTFLQRIVIENSIELIEQGLVDPSVTEFTPETIKAATVVVTVLPMLAVYPFVQKYFVKGIMLGSVKE